MKIVVMEPLGVKMEQINALAAPLQAMISFIIPQKKPTRRSCWRVCSRPILSCWPTSR